MVKKSACSAVDPGSIPGLGRSPGEGNDNPFQYTCLENSMDRRAWQATSPWDCRELDTTEHINKIITYGSNRKKKQQVSELY